MAKPQGIGVNTPAAVSCALPSGVPAAPATECRPWSDRDHLKSRCQAKPPTPDHRRKHNVREAAAHPWARSQIPLRVGGHVNQPTASVWK